MLDRLLPSVLFEMPEMGGGDAVVADPLESGAGEGTPEGSGAGEQPVVPEPAPATPAAPVIDWNDPTIQAQLDARADAALNARLAAAGLAPAAPETPQFELDPFSPEYPQQLVTVLEAVLEQRLGGVESIVQERQAQEFETTIGQSIEKLVAEGSDFHGLDPEAVRLVGEAFATRVDPNSGDPVNAALTQGATWLKGVFDKQRTEAVNDYKRQIGEIVDTPAEPSGSGAGLRIEERGKGSYDEIINRHAGRFEPHSG